MICQTEQVDFESSSCYSRLLPHGKMVLFPAASLSVASICSLLTLVSCSFVMSESDPNQFGFTYSSSMGFWPECISAQYGVSGLVVNDVEEAIQDDVARRVAMALGIVACAVGMVATMLLWPITCKLYKTKWIELTGGLVVLALICQLVTFVMFQTEFCHLFGGCRLGWGGVMSIVAAIFWLIGIFGIWWIPIKTKQIANPTQEQAPDSRAGGIGNVESGVNSGNVSTPDPIVDTTVNAIAEDTASKPGDVEVSV